MNNKKGKTVHLELKTGDTVLVRLQNKKFPDKDKYVVTEVKNGRIAAKNKKNGRKLKT